MKKTLLAIAIPAIMVASSASAAFDFYNEGRVRVWTDGDFIVVAGTTFDKSNNARINVDTAKLGFGVEVAIDSCLSAFAYTRFRLEKDGYDNKVNSGAGSAKNDQAYVGLKCSNWGAVSAGRMYLISDNMGISDAHNFDGGIGAGNDGTGLGLLGTHSDAAVKYEYGTMGDQGFYFGASYGSPVDTGSWGVTTPAHYDASGLWVDDIYGSVAGTGSANKNGMTSYDLAIGYRQDWFEIRAFYAARRDANLHVNNGSLSFDTGFDPISGKAKGKIDAWDLETFFYFDAWTLGLSYGQTRYKSGLGSYAETDFTGMYSAAMGTVYRGYAANLDGSHTHYYDEQTAQMDSISAIVNYQINTQWKVGLGLNYAKIKADRSGYYDASGYWTNNQFSNNVTNAYMFLDYQMHKNVKLFSEVGYLSTTSASSNDDAVFYDDKYRNYAFEVGMEVTF